MGSAGSSVPSSEARRSTRTKTARPGSPTGEATGCGPPRAASGVNDVGVVAEVHPAGAHGPDPLQRVLPGRRVARLAGRQVPAGRVGGRARGEGQVPGQT